jgi:hypothetical protein
MTVSVGRTVHYRVLHGARKGECRAAVVVRVTADGAELFVFAAVDDDMTTGPKLAVREGAEPGQWHWPEREPAAEVHLAAAVALEDAAATAGRAAESIKTDPPPPKKKGR